jgi:MATE family multidrug resistance protein
MRFEFSDMSILLHRERSRTVFTLAGPVIVGMISQTLLNVVDTAMVGRLGSTSLAATGMGGLVFWLTLGSLSALNEGTQAITARRVGEGRSEAAGQVIDNSVVIALAMGLTTSVLGVLFAPKLFPLIIHDPEVGVLGSGYLRARYLGAVQFMLIFAFRGFFNGIGRTVIHMRIAILVNVVNVFLNWLLIFGNLGAPKLGVMGAGLASAAGTTAGAVGILWTAYLGSYRHKYQLLRKGNASWEVKKNIMRLALPTTVQHGLAMVAWTVFLSLIGLIGTVEQAASNVVVTIMSLSFLPGVSFGIAASTLISQRLGEQEPEEAELMGWEAAKLAALFMGSMGVVFLLFPELLLRIFTPEIEVIQTGVVPLRIMGAVQVFDGVGMTMGSALQGAGMNRWVMVVEVSISWFIFIPLAYLGGIVAGWGMFGAWSAVGVYLVMYAVACSWKFAGKSWQKVRI